METCTDIFAKVVYLKGYYYSLKKRQQISKKNGVLKCIIHVIKHANFQRYRVYSDRVIWKN